MGRIAPERRKPIDLVVVAIIAVIVVAVGVVVWWVSPARHTDSTQAAHPAADLLPTTTVPAKLEPRWHAASAATSMPAVGRSTVVTADGDEVVGHDARTGAPTWHYRRDLPLCGTLVAWPAATDEALAVYRDSRGCSEVTALDATTGARRAARTSDADTTLRLHTDNGYVVAQGPTRLETWGSNMVRGIAYGRVSDPVKPGVQPGRSGCVLDSSAVGGNRVAVIEHCDGDRGYRLTVLGAVLDSDEKVQQFGSSEITPDRSRPAPTLISMTSSAIAVYDGGPGGTGAAHAQIRRFNADGAPTESNLVTGARTPPPGSVALTSTGVVTYFTGTATVVLDNNSLRPLYQVPGALGPGEVMGDRLLLPSPSGVSVRDAATGREVRTIVYRREDAAPSGAPVILRVLGDLVAEQRGSEVSVYAPP